MVPGALKVDTLYPFVVYVRIICCILFGSRCRHKIYIRGDCHFVEANNELIAKLNVPT